MSEAERLSSALFDDFHGRLAAGHAAQTRQALQLALYSPPLALRLTGPTR